MRARIADIAARPRRTEPLRVATATAAADDDDDYDNPVRVHSRYVRRGAFYLPCSARTASTRAVPVRATKQCTAVAPCDAIRLRFSNLLTARVVRSRPPANPTRRRPFDHHTAMSLNTAHVQGGGCLIHAGEWWVNTKALDGPTEERTPPSRRLGCFGSWARVGVRSSSVHAAPVAAAIRVVFPGCGDLRWGFGYWRNVTQRKSVVFTLTVMTIKTKVPSVPFLPVSWICPGSRLQKDSVHCRRAYRISVLRLLVLACVQIFYFGNNL